MPIRLKLTTLFLAFTLIPTILVSILTFNDYTRTLEASRLSDLRDIAAFKSDKIDVIFTTLKKNIEMSQSFWNIRKNLPTLTSFSHDTANPEFLEARKTLDEQLKPMQEILDLDSIMLLNSEGKLVYSTDAADLQKNFLNPLVDPGQKVFEEGKKRVYFSDIFLHKEANNSLDMFISAPALDQNGALIGVIVFDVKMPPIYGLIQDTTGLGKTGETAIGKKIRGSALYLNPLKYYPEAALKREVKIGGKTGIPMQEAVQGREGVGHAIDYRGREVIAAWQYIPSLSWGMVVKIDVEEAFADIAKMRNLVILILVSISIILLLIALFISHAIASPINRLAKCAERVGAGNLDCKSDVHTKDEIGRLSQTFNKMIEDLRRSTTSIDNLNKEIAERKNVEMKLADSVREWETTFNSITDLVSIHSKDCRIVRVNKAYADAFKMKPEDIIGKKCHEVMHESDEPHAGCPHMKALESKKTQLLEYFEPHLGAYFEVSASPIFDSKGDVIATVHIVKNITERRKSEEALRKLAAIVESSYDAIISKDHNGIITSWNRGAERLYGYTEKEILGSNISVIVPEDRVDELRLMMQKIWDGESLENFETIRVRKDGIKVQVSLTISAIRDSDDRVIGASTIAHDITERKRLEELLLKYSKELEREVEEKTHELKESQDKLIRSEKLAIVGKLASSVAHELRNPLGVIKNVVYYLNMLELPKQNPEVSENLDIITQEIENSDKIITDLLEFSRATAPVFHPENINFIIKEVLDRIKTGPEITLLLELQNNLPDIEIDALQMHQVFYNLVKNALEAMEKGGILKIRTELKGELVEIALSDTGIGIPKENIGKVFEPLFSTKTKGTGLGLSVCATLVERHGGKIEVDSEIGKGATFTVKLPVRRGQV